MNTLSTSIVLFSLCNLAWAQDPAIPCLDQLKNDPKIQILAGKMPFDVTKGQPLEVLANKSKPTAQEKAALSFFVTEGERCFSLGTEWRQQNYPPEGSALLEAHRVDMVSAFADLYAGNITFGDLAKIRAKAASDLKINVEALVRDLTAKYAEKEKRQQEAAAQQIQAERQAQERREAIARQQRFAREQADRQQEEAALQFLMNRRPSQAYEMQPYQMPIPKTTNCSTYGNQTNCTTR